VATLKIHSLGLDHLVATIFDPTPPLFGLQPLFWEPLG